MLPCKCHVREIVGENDHVASVRVQLLDDECSEGLLLCRSFKVSEGEGNELLVDSWDIVLRRQEGWSESSLEVVVAILQSEVLELEESKECLGDLNLESLEVDIKEGKADGDTFIKKSR